MLEHRTTTLVGSHALFVALSAALWRFPALGPSLFPWYGLVFFWADHRRETETSIIFLGMATAAGVLLATQSPAITVKAALAAEVAALWALYAAVSRHRDRASLDERQGVVEKTELEAGIRDDEKELARHEGYQKEISGQIRLRRDLVESAKSLGATLDGQEVRSRLVGILSARFPGASVEIAAAPGADLLLIGAAQRQGPALAADRSAMAIPLKVMRQPAGFLKVAAAPNAFSSEDVKTADLFATMAALSLENIQFYEHVHAQATHDPLTQLFSHKAFQERLQEELLRAGRNQTPLSIVLCDLDHFKGYNDRYGHQAGDHLLRTVGGLLAAFARPVDMAARYGGEEFALILPNFVRSEAVDLANRLRARVAAEPFVFQGQKTTATMSLGVASYPQDATTSSQMVRVADERLYRAKTGGRNQVVG